MQGEKMKVLKIRKKIPTDIVFSSIYYMTEFFEEIIVGKAVILDFADSTPRAGEFINPSIMSDISDNKLIIRSEEGRK